MMLLRSALAVCVLAFWAGPPSRAQGEPPPRSPDERLWAEIAALREEPATSEPADRHLLEALNGDTADPGLARRRRLLDRLELYLRLYPGGPRRDEAVVLELDTAFEIGVLTGGRFDDLCRRASEYCRAPPSAAALHEAAYWQIVCRRLERGSGAAGGRTVPSTHPAHDAELLREFRTYLEQYPGSRRAPRLAEVLFDDARRRGDRGEMRRLVERLAGAQLGHPVAERLRAQLRREEAVGQAFDVRLRLTDGSTHEIARDRGRIVVLVVWAGFDRDSRERLREVWDAARQDADLRLVGVNLDLSAEDMTAACRELGVGCPQAHDGRGWAGDFALEWGVRELPLVLVVDRRGRLVGSTAGEDWRELLSRAGAD